MLQNFKNVIVLALLACVVVGCSSKPQKQEASYNKNLDPFAGKGSPYYQGKGKIPLGGGRYHVGKPYQVAGRWFTPKEQPGYDKSGMASWYGEAFHRRKTSNGEYFDMNQLTAAHPTLPIPSYAKVTNLSNGRTVVVRINDRGPFVGTRIIDLSKRTADALEFRHRGKTEVRVQWLGRAPINDTGSHLAMMNTKLHRGSNLSQLAAATGQRANSTQVAEYEPKVAPVQRVSVAQDESFSSGGFIVHAATFTSATNAKAAQEYLATIAATQILQLSGQDGLVYRVHVGPVATLSEAQSILRNVKQSGFPEALVRQINVQQVAAAAQN